MVVLNDGRAARMANVGESATVLDISLVSSEFANRITWDVEDENLGADHFMIIMVMDENRVFGLKREILDSKKWVEKMNEILSERNLNAFIQLNNEIARAKQDCSKVIDMREIQVNGWWNNEIEYWYERKLIALREFSRNKNSENKVVYGRMNGKLKKAIRKAKRKSWREYVSQMTHSTTSKDVWRLFNRVNGRKLNIKNLICKDREKGEAFVRMLLNVDHITNPNEANEQNQMRIEYTDKHIEWGEFLDNAKSTTPGTNGVSYRMFQLLSNQALQNLLGVLNKVWMGSRIPKKWKESKVVPIPKRDRDPNTVVSYRGICMLKFFIKIVNGMIKEKIECFMNEKTLLPPTIRGFRKNRSASECLKKLVWEVRKDKMKVVVVFLDIIRAYDYVVPWKLEEILSKYPFSSKLCEWVKEFSVTEKLC